MTTNPSNDELSNDRQSSATTIEAMAASSAGVSVGEWFKTHREQRGLTALEVSEQIKWSVRQIEALEANQWRELPKAAILKGFLKAYARILEADPAPIFSALQLDSAPADAAVAPERITGDDAPRLAGGSFLSDLRHSRFGRLGLGLYLLIALALIVAVAIWWFLHKPVSDQPVPDQTALVQRHSNVSTSSSSVSSAPSQQWVQPASVNNQPANPQISIDDAAQTAGKSANLTVIFNGDAWIEVRDARGAILLSERATKGQERRIMGVPPYQLVVRNAAKLELWRQGKKLAIPPQINDQLSHFTVL